MSRRVLVAGLGNVFLGDDAFGVEVARELGRLDLPEGVVVGDFGVAGMHLAYELLDGYDAAVLVDAMARGEAPGTVTVLEPAAAEPGAAVAMLSDPATAAGSTDAHGMQPEVVLTLLEALGGSVGEVLIVGCEPESLEPEMGLSDAVAAAVPVGVQCVVELVGKLVAGPLGADRPPPDAPRTHQPLREGAR